MRRWPSRWRAAIPVLVAVALLWRIAYLRAEGGHRSEAGRLIGTRASALVPELGPKVGSAVLYFYQESCPYCGIDHLMVQEAVALAGTRVTAFVPVHLGRSVGQAQYWEHGAGTVLVQLTAIPIDKARAGGVEAVPILAVVRNDTIVSAWSGKLRWELADVGRAIGCRLGAWSACIVLAVRDVGRAIGNRVSAIGAIFSKQAVESNDDRTRLDNDPNL